MAYYMRLKYFIATFFLFFAIAAPAQRFYHTSFGNISPKELANSLTADAKNDEQKVYALFRWITDNVDYRLKPVGIRAILPDTSTILRPLDEIVAEHVLVNKVAVCDGYSRLFKTLCNYAGIKCEIINGYAKNGTERLGKRFRTNHTWNAVYIDGAWKLLDVTWASGYVSFRGDYFIRQYEPKYYLPPPEDFIRDHYPEDAKWTLMPSVPTLEEFRYAPFKTQAFVRSKIKGFLPASGILHAQVGDTVNIFVETDQELKDLMLSDGSGSVYAFTDPKQNEPVYKKLSNVSYVVTHKNDAWLDVLFEDEVLLRYKLIVKEKNQ